MSEAQYDKLDPEMLYVPFRAEAVKVTAEGLFYEVGPSDRTRFITSRAADDTYEDSPREEAP